MAGANETTTWVPEELQRIGAAEEIGLASRRPDGSLRPFVTMWVVHTWGDLYVRSAYGPENPWYRRATASGAGRIRAGASSGKCPSPRLLLRPRVTSTPLTTPSMTATGRGSLAPSSARARIG
jgi:hypothetical protein